MVDGGKRRFRVGLALSGGGFRASLFHLGTIRRLEELNLMADIDAMSTVSGGSIIGAYYLLQMERKLRERPDAVRLQPGIRVEIWQEIAREFVDKLEHNLRTRALVFTPYYHPWLAFKTLVSRPFRVAAFSELIQAEFDKWFYFHNTLAQLPSVPPRLDRKRMPGSLHGPRLMLNTTSLLTGQRVVFMREPDSSMSQLKGSKRNRLKLSRVVGASSCVPGLFPPTAILGDMLVDGGVSDNQGIEALLEWLESERRRDCANNPGTGNSLEPSVVEVLLVGDASGQMELKHTISPRRLPVLKRTNDVFQHQVRMKLLDALVQWRETRKESREFAFTHLLLSLKDRDRPDLGQSVPRVSTELIPALAGIRTDLDQFSPIEAESLMYHGYTLIDAQLKKWCPQLLEAYQEGALEPVTAPLFTADPPPRSVEQEEAGSTGLKGWIQRHWGSTVKLEYAAAWVRRDLEAGRQMFYLARCLKKYRLPVALCLATCAMAYGLLAWLGWQYRKPLWELLLIAWQTPSVLNTMNVSVAGALKEWGIAFVRSAGFVAGAFAAIYLLLLPAFLTFGSVRRLVHRLDLRKYRECAGGGDFDTRWVKSAPSSADEKNSIR